MGLITDGRPERRPWWDNRSEYGQGWTGVNVPLPGGPIISSGLRNTSAGTPIKVPTAALDATAASSNPGNVSVFVVGLGDGGSSNWNAFYSDLFSNQTFNNASGTWNYQSDLKAG